MNLMIQNNQAIALSPPLLEIFVTDNPFGVDHFWYVSCRWRQTLVQQTPGYLFMIRNISLCVVNHLTFDLFSQRLCTSVVSRFILTNRSIFSSYLYKLIAVGTLRKTCNKFAERYVELVECNFWQYVVTGSAVIRIPSSSDYLFVSTFCRMLV